MTHVLHITRFSSSPKKHAATSGVSSYSQNLLEAIASEKLLPGHRQAILDISAESRHEQAGSWQGTKVVRPRGKSMRAKLQAARQTKKNFKPDVVHIQHEFNLFGGYFSTLLLVPIKGIFFRIPFITTIHGVPDPNYLSSDFLSQNHVVKYAPKFLVWTAFFILNQIIARTSATIVVHEDRFRDILRHKYFVPDRKITVIHHGVEDLQPMSKTAAKRQLKLPTSKPMALFIGYYTGYKGIDVLVNSISKITVPLTVVIGSGMHPRMADLEKYVDEYSALMNRAVSVQNENVTVRWVGFVEDDELPSYYSAADVFVLPYKQTLASSGPGSLAVAYNVPVLASVEFEGVFEDHALFATNPESCAEKISESIKNLGIMKLGQEVFRERRLWKHVAHQTVRLYNASI